MRVIGQKQRATIEGSPRVVHGLRVAQPGGGDAFTSPQPGQRWATGGQPGARVIGACCCCYASRLNAARSSRRRDTLRRARTTSALDLDVIARSSRRVRMLTAVTLLACTCAPRSLAPSSLRRMGRKQRASYTGHPWPSPLNTVLRPSTLGSYLALACAGVARAETCLSRRAACARSRTPCTPAASSDQCCPHPRVARRVLALSNQCGARSRGYWRPLDITRCYAHTSCVYRAACAIHGA